MASASAAASASTSAAASASAAASTFASSLLTAQEFMMEPARYTPFPDLRSSPIRAGHDHARHSTSVVVEAPHDVLVIAWAMLLRSYTEDVAPTFKVYASSVTVDTANWASPVVKYLKSIEGERLTGILTHKAGPSID